jgi:hypothetical protein
MPKKRTAPKPLLERSAAEVSALARSLMKRMLDSPPVSHERLTGHGKPKRARKKRAK